MNPGNDFFKDNFFEQDNHINTEQKEDYVPMSYEEAAAQRATIKNPYSHPDYTYPKLKRAALILRLFTAVAAALFIIINILAFVTDGAIFFLRKTPATIKEVTAHMELYRRGLKLYDDVAYKLTVEYDYYGAPKTAEVVSHSKKNVGDTDYIYMSKMNSFSIYYPDGYHTLFEATFTMIRMSIIALAISCVLNDYGRWKLNKDLGFLERANRY